MVLLSPPSSDASPAQGPRRCAPNLPGSLTRFLSRRLAIDATTAMRVALLYGDMEWQAGGGTRLRYSASDYARRQGLHRNTVHADIQRLVSLAAIELELNRANEMSITLHGLSAASEGEEATAVSDQTPCLSEQQPLAEPLSIPSPLTAATPCPSPQQPLAALAGNPLLQRAATLEKTSKTLEKNKREKAEPPPTQKQEQSQQTDSPQSSQQQKQPSAPTPSFPRKPAVHQETSSKKLEAAAPKTGAADRLLAAVLETYREHRPPEWPAPGALTLTSGRRARLQKALAHAGSPEALLQRLRTALEQVPPWFRRTYPQRPDGSRRPAHQFVDLLFRSTASESDCGPEAWHLFAWSEAGARGPGHIWGMAGTALGHSTPETDLQKAQRLFLWDSGVWRAQGREALLLTLQEKRELAALLEAHGQGIPGTAERQFAEAEAPAPGPPVQPAPDASAPTHRPRPGLWRQQPSTSAASTPSVLVHRGPRQPRHPRHSQAQSAALRNQAS